MDLAEPPLDPDRASRMLSRAEASRSDRFGSAPMRRRFVLGRAALRVMLARALEIDAADVPLAEREDGKPYVAADPPIWFNLAHSGDVLLIALSGAGEVGIDVELLRPLPARDALVRRVFTPAERELLAAVDESERTRIFFRGWTRKEAVLKATGRGLRIAPASIEVSLDDPVRCEWRYVGPGDPPADSPGALRGLAPTAGCEAAVAVREATRISCRRWPR